MKYNSQNNRGSNSSSPVTGVTQLVAVSCSYQQLNILWCVRFISQDQNQRLWQWQGRNSTSVYPSSEESAPEIQSSYSACQISIYFPFPSSQMLSRASEVLGAQTTPKSLLCQSATLEVLYNGKRTWFPFWVGMSLVPASIIIDGLLFFVLFFGGKPTHSLKPTLETSVQQKYHQYRLTLNSGVKVKINWIFLQIFYNSSYYTVSPIYFLSSLNYHKII